MDETDDQLRSAELVATPYVERLADARRELAAAQEERDAAVRRANRAAVVLRVFVPLWLVALGASAFFTEDLRRLVRSQAAIAEAQRGDYQREIDALNRKLAIAQSETQRLSDDKNRVQLIGSMRELYAQNVRLRQSCAAESGKEPHGKQ